MTSKSPSSNYKLSSRMANKGYLSPQLQQKIHRMRRSGKSAYKIAIELRRSFELIEEFLLRVPQGVVFEEVESKETKKKHIPKKDPVRKTNWVVGVKAQVFQLRKIIKLKEEGLKVPAIAEKIGLSDQCIAHVLSKKNWKKAWKIIEDETIS